MPIKYEVLNSLGDVTQLTKREKAVVKQMQKKFNEEFRNALGYNVDITTLTTVLKSIIDQNFYEIAFADYIPVRVGEGAWGQQLVAYQSFQLGADFETGLLNTGASSARLASADAGIQPVYTQINNWAKQIDWNLIDLAMASKSQNWDLITAKEESRKTNWDLGVQRTSFLGFRTNTSVRGLLTLPGVNANTALITKYIHQMSTSEFNTFVQGVVNAYRVNCEYTRYPDRFVIPEADWNGLVAPVSEDFPVVTKLEYLQRAFETVTGNKNFKIMPLAYANKLQNADVPGLNKNRYILYRYDDKTVRMDIPADYNSTLQNTINGFSYQNVGYGQLTGAQVYRTREVLYFDWS